jgi:iron complex outermembrane receptor protein
VANYTWDVPGGELAANLAGNINDTEIRGQIDTPDPIRDAGVNIFDRKEQSRLLSARPDTKFLLGFSYSAGPVRATLNNTRFGAVIWQHADDPGKDQTFDPRLVTDAQLEYTVTDNVRVGVSVNNLFNVYPEAIDPKGDPVTDLGGRFRYPWEVNQFGFNGTTVTGNLNVRF